MHKQENDYKQLDLEPTSEVQEKLNILVGVEPSGQGGDSLNEEVLEQLTGGTIRLPVMNPTGSNW